MYRSFSLFLVIVTFTFLTSSHDRPSLDRLTGSLKDYIGFSNGSYFIEVPEGQIDEFFRWNSDYPDLISAHRGGFITGFPENAIATFENTLTTAPALLEVDVRRTGDGEWILNRVHIENWSFLKKQFLFPTPDSRLPTP